MTIKDNKYPNKNDLEPKVPKKGKPAGPTDELPLSDPADSNFSHVVHEQEKTGEDGHRRIKDDSKNTSHNEQAHKEWNDSKPTK